MQQFVPLNVQMSPSQKLSHVASPGLFSVYSCGMWFEHLFFFEQGSNIRLRLPCCLVTTKKVKKKKRLWNPLKVRLFHGWSGLNYISWIRSEEFQSGVVWLFGRLQLIIRDVWRYFSYLTTPTITQTNSLPHSCPGCSPIKKHSTLLCCQSTSSIPGPQRAVRAPSCSLAGGSDIVSKLRNLATLHD